MSDSNPGTPIDAEKLGIYIVEGTVEVDPLNGHVTIRTVHPKTGNPLSFDPIPPLALLDGKEVRFILTPMASVSIIEELHKKALEGNTPEEPGSN
jgi:hypothetical protein